MRNTKYTVIDFDADIESLVVKYTYDGERHTINVRPILEGEGGEVDVEATHYSIERHIRGAHERKTSVPSGIEKLIGKQRTVSKAAGPEEV